MGARGPAPEPTALKLIKGNPGKRALNPNEPKPRRKRPHCPEYLDEAARKEWRRLLPILQHMRVLTEADYITLANLCQQYSMLMKAQEQLTKSGLLFKTPSGYIQQSPLVSIVSNCTAQVTALCREFGLTPSARTRVQAQGEEEKPAESPWEALKRRTSNAL